MDEARRFLRYVTPGLLFASLVLVLLAILDHRLVALQVDKLKEGGGVAVLVAALLASGGLGFVFSAVHHSLHWRDGENVVDHSDLVHALRRAEVIEIRRLSKPPQAISGDISREEAWIVASGLWHQRLGSSEQLKCADTKTVVIADLMHSLGTARVAAVAATVCSFAIVSAVEGAFPRGPRSWLVLGIGLAVTWLAQASYARTGKFAQRVIELILADVLHRERESRSTPIPTYAFIPEKASEASAT